MIEVPARVKDALKSEDYKKNYKITAPDAAKESEKLYSPPAEIVDGKIGITFFMVGFQEGDVAKVSYAGEVSWGVVDITPEDTSYPAYQVYPTVRNGETYFKFDYVGCAVNVVINDAQGPSGLFYFDMYREIPWIVDNNNLVAESVKFDERMCSDTELKFGLCEGTSVEFQYFDFPNIRNYRIKIELDVEYKNEHGSLAWYTIPMGWFDVDECSRQASTGIIKATAYNKLKSSYLNQSVKNDILDLIVNGSGGFEDKIAVGVVLEDLMGGYQGTKEIPIEPEATPSDNQAGICYNYRICNSERELSNYWLFAYCKPVLLTIENVNRLYYYRFEAQCQQLCQWLENYTLRNPVTGTDMSPLDFLVSWVGYIPPGGGSPPVNDAVPVRAGLASDNTPDDAPKMMRYILRFRKPPESAEERIALDRRIYHDGYEHKTDLTNWYGNLRVEETLINLSGTIPCGGLMFYLPTVWTTEYFSPGTAPGPSYDPFTQEQKDAARLTAETLVQSFSQAFQMELDAIEGTEITLDDVLSWQDVTLRDLQSAVFEIECKYGKLSRTLDLFEGITLNNSRLFPADDLYPANDLYPNGVSEAGYPAMYSKLWADEGNVRSFRNLNITYKTTETIDDQTQVVEKVISRTVNADGTDDYDMTDNWLFRNLVWTNAKVEAYANQMVNTLRDIRWFPFEMWCVGLPYIEAGDELEITMEEDTYRSYVLRRTLNGIQNLQDEMINGTLDIF